MGLLPSWDSFTHRRPSTTADAEGNAFNGVVTVGEGSGVCGSATTQEQQVASQRGIQLDAFLSTEYNGMRNGDVVVVRGKTWTVVSVKNVRLHNRIGLRETDARPVNI